MHPPCIGKPMQRIAILATVVGVPAIEQDKSLRELIGYRFGFGHADGAGMRIAPTLRRNPSGATEIYDGLDNDCDDEIDEGVAQVLRGHDGDGCDSPTR